MEEQHTARIDAQGRVIQITRRTGPSAASPLGEGEVAIPQVVYAHIQADNRSAHKVRWSRDARSQQLVRAQVEEREQQDGTIEVKVVESATVPIEEQS